MEKTLNIIWIIAQVAIGYNLVLPLFLYIFYSLSRRKNHHIASYDYKPDYAVIITAYQYVNTLPDVVASVLKINYDRFLVYIVADNCDVSSLHFNDERVILLRPEEVLRGNTKSHFYAIERFKREHDVLTIIDSDNIVDPEYLNNLTPYFANGFEAVQGSREAKNLDSMYSCLDAARDIYYHFFDCKVLFNLGSSSTLSGSGMAFTTNLYKACLADKDVSGAGFDKVLQAAIVKRNKRIAFSPNAVVYDEKTSRPTELVNQRSRWINTWFKYFRFGFSLIAKGLVNFSRNQFIFGLILLRPPLFIFLILSVFMMMANLFINPAVSVVWLLGFIAFVGCFVQALMVSKADKRIFKSLSGIPNFMFYQLISLTKIFKANKRSVSTQHFHTSNKETV